jgi:hypothetical protein
MADFDFLETEFGISESDLQRPQSVYERLVEDVANQIVKDLRKEIEDKGAVNRREMLQSTVPVPKGTLTFEIESTDYYKFIDEGVNPVGQNKYNTPYQFKVPFVSGNHAKALQQSYGYTSSHAYASAYVTKNKYGIKPRNITESVINDAYLNRIANDLLEATGLMFEVAFEKNTE